MEASDRPTRGNAVRFRRARAEDTPGVTRCVTDAYARYRAEAIDLPNVTEGLEDEIDRCPSWVAIAGDSIVGFAVLHDDETMPILANLAVDPAFGGRKIGTALILLMEKHCSAHGHSSLGLVTHVELPGLRSYYEALGFVVMEVDPPRVRMSKTLK